MCGDVYFGHSDNAEAGYEIMMEPNDMKPVPGLRNDIDQEYENTGNTMGLCPFPLQWDNLYLAWNLAFCSNFSNNIFYYAKLICPVVSGTYQEVHPGLFLCPRVICLLLIFHYQVCIAAEPTGPKITLIWKSEALSRHIASVNVSNILLAFS